MPPTQGSSINISMRPTDAARYHELSVWNPLEQDWSQNSWTWADPAGDSTVPASQASVATHFDANAPTSSQDAHNAASQTMASQQAPADLAFCSIDFGRYSPAEAISELDRAINAANSAIVLVSQPSQDGGVQGHMYGLDGELIGHGTVDPPEAEPSSGLSAGLSAEEESQQRAVELLLEQMIGATNPHTHDSQSQPYSADASQSFADSQSQSFHDAQQWPEWQHPSFRRHHLVRSSMRQSRRETQLLHDPQQQPRRTNFDTTRRRRFTSPRRYRQETPARMLVARPRRNTASIKDLQNGTTMPGPSKTWRTLQPILPR